MHSKDTTNTTNWIHSIIRFLERTDSALENARVTGSAIINTFRPFK